MAAPTRLFETLLRRPRLVLLLFGAATLLAVPGLLRLRLDNSPESFFLRDAQALDRYREFQRAFGRDRALRLVANGPGLWSREGLGWFGAVEERAGALRGVIGAAGLWSHHRDHLGGWPPADPAAFRARVLGDVLDRNAGFVGKGGESATILVVLAQLPAAEERALLRRLEALLAAPPPEVRASMAGLPVLQRTFDREVVRFAKRFFPLLVALAALIVGPALGGFRNLFPPFAFVFVCQTVLFGAMGAAGVRLDVVRMILFPLLFVIPLATAVHLTVRFRQIRRGGAAAAAAVRRTWKEKGWPVLWTGVTTAAGLGSLAHSGVPPVRSLGLWSALGLAWMTLAAFTLLPALLLTWPGGWARVRSFEVRSRRWGRLSAAAALRAGTGVLLVFGLIALVAAAGLPRLRQESGALIYLPAEHPVRRQIAALEEEGIGIVAADVVLVDRRPGNGPGGFAEVSGLSAVARLAARLRQEAGVLGAASAGDVVRSEADWEGRGPEHGVLATEAGELEKLRQDRHKRRLLMALASWDGRWTRISVFVPMRGFEDLEPLFGRLAATAREAFPEADVWLTGRYPLVLTAQRTLLRTMIVSLGLTFLVVTLVFRWVLGSGRFTLLALVPNLWPVLVVLGVMGWSDVPLDSSTVMIASVVLGLAVDDTLHTLGAFRRVAGRLDARRAVVAALGKTVPAHLLTTGVLSLGFLICGRSAFVPVGRFGTLTAVALVTALAADLWLVPVLLGKAPLRALTRLRRGP